MTKVTIETINGKQCTVIRKPFDAAWVKGELARGIPMLVDKTYTDQSHTSPHSNYQIITKDDVAYFSDYVRYEHSNYGDIITILPPLPRNPKPEDAPLLYRYMAEGLMPKGEFLWLDKTKSGLNTHHLFDRINKYSGAEITHAEHNGERVEIAIEEK